MTTPVRTRAWLFLGLALFTAAALLVMFQVARTPPEVSCAGPSSASEWAEVDAYRAWSYPFHVLGAALVLAGLVWLSRCGRKTLAATVAYAALIVAGELNHDIYAAPGLFGYFGFILVAPAAILATAAGAALVAAGRTSGGVLSLQVAGWLGLLLLIPGEFAFVWFIDEPLCL